MMIKAQKTIAGDDRRSLRCSWGWRFAGTHDVDWHEHREAELVLVRSGKCWVEADGQKMSGEARSLFVLPPGVPQYQGSDSGRVETTCLGLEAPGDLFDSGARVMPLNPNDPLCVWIEQLCDWQLIHPPMGEDVKQRLLELLVKRIREIDVAMGREAGQHPAVATAVGIFHENLAEPLTLEGVAKKVGISVSHLVAVFRQECGCSPMRYLQRCRMERAEWLLDNPYLRINEVAEACGYQDVNYFVRLFAQIHGQPPGRWRKQRAIRPTGSLR